MCGPYDTPLRIFGYFCVFHILPIQLQTPGGQVLSLTELLNLSLEQHPVKMLLFITHSFRLVVDHFFFKDKTGYTWAIF